MRVHTRQIEAEVPIDTPMGPMVARYGRTRYGGDGLGVKYRGDDIEAPTKAALLREIEKAEAEHQIKRARDAKRADLRKNPLDAVLLHVGGTSVTSVRTGQKRKADGFFGEQIISVRQRRAEQTVLEDVKVRGQDLRTYGSALIVRANGDKEQHPITLAEDKRFHRKFVPSIGGTVLLTDLEDHQRTDVLAACRAVEQASADRALGQPSDEALYETYGDEPIELSVSYDPATDERVAQFRGREIRQDSVARVQQYAKRILLHDAGWTLDAEDGTSVLDGTGHIGDVCRTAEEYAEQRASEDRIEAALEALAETIADLHFDGTLLELPEDEPTTEPEESSGVPRVQAPDTDGEDW